MKNGGRSIILRDRFAGAAVALLCLLMASSAGAVTPASVGFPPDTTSREVVERWIDDHLDLRGYIASGWSQNALFFASTARLMLNQYPVVRTAIWTEVINPAAAAAAGWRSSIAAVEFDCGKHRYRDLSRANYVGPSGSGQSMPGTLASLWQTADPGSTMGTTQEEVCYRAKLARTHPSAPKRASKPPAK